VSGRTGPADAGDGDALELRITGIAAGGAGVGRAADGRAIFVHRTAPGERVKVRLTVQKPRWAKAELQQVLEPAPSRREAPCRFYDRCGGCTLEHMEYGAQLDAKARIVADALERIGGVAAPAPEVVASPAEFRYRNRVSFTLVRMRGGGVVAGFHELLRPERVLDIDESCLMPELAVAEAWAAVRRSWGADAGRLPSGTRLRLTVRASAGGRTALLVQGGYGRGRPDELLARVPSLEAIWHQPRASDAPLLLAGESRLDEAWQEEDLALGGAVFLQVNRGAAALLEQHVLELAGRVEGLRVVDAYCGVGLHARRLARAGAEVVGIELDAAAVAEARRTVPGARFLAARVEDAISDVLPADLVVLNPPRAGLEEAAAAALVERPAARLIYVSCDPATLARDVKRLAAAYRLERVRCFDLFPQTSHVETVAELACSIM
jgi:23S rRNA (uracil1939-C5)-methyltransferase